MTTVAGESSTSTSVSTSNGAAGDSSGAGPSEASGADTASASTSASASASTSDGGDTGADATTLGTSATTATSGDPPPDCGALADCEACGAEAGCGWCGATGTCSAGDATGPDAGVCTGGWVIEGDFFSCPAADCFARTSCADCQDAYIGCGWCASSGTCMPGAPDQPAPGGECADQQWYFDICPEDCADEMTCVSCTGTVGCGWCSTSSTCTAGTDAGPILGACAGGWSTAVDACF